jgi:hypothetical protein
MNALLLTLLSLLVQDPKMPCDVQAVRTQQGPAHALVCILAAPLPPADAANIPPELAPLFQHDDADAAPDAPEQQAAPAPKAPKSDEGHIDGDKNNRPHGLYRVSFGG